MQKDEKNTIDKEENDFDQRQSDAALSDAAIGICIGGTAYISNEI